MTQMHIDPAVRAFLSSATCRHFIDDGEPRDASRPGKGKSGRCGSKRSPHCGKPVAAEECRNRSCRIGCCGGNGRATAFG